jgi:hypothetical protein
MAWKGGCLMSRDLATHDLDAAYTTAKLSIFLSVAGWACVVIGMCRRLRGTRSE